MSRETKIAPSILAADFGKLAEDIKKVELAGADLLHLDVMDGKFVPNISFGFPIIEAVKKTSHIPLDIHLMIEKPELFIDEFSKYEPEIITVHQETCPHLHKTIYQIKEKGIKAGVALNPATPFSSLLSIIEEIDMVLFMTVNPGFGGQKFIKSVLKKIKEANEYRANNVKCRDLLFQVDGGVNQETALSLRQQQVDILVAGSAIFNSENPTEAILNLRG